MRRYHVILVKGIRASQLLWFYVDIENFDSIFRPFSQSVWLLHIVTKEIVYLSEKIEYSLLGQPIILWQILTVDLTGRAPGRGAYVCKDNPDCLEKAYKRKALERSLQMAVTAENKDAVFAQLKESAGE